MGNNSSINGERCPYVVTYCLEKIVDMPSVAFIVSRDISPIGNNVDDREFYLSVDHELYTRLGIENCTSVWSPDKFVRKLMLVGKSDTEAFFFMRFEIQ